jgi:hypothetical protein
MNSLHLHALSALQEHAFQALGLGPQWVPRSNVGSSSETGLVDMASAPSLLIISPPLTITEKQLLSHMLQAIGLTMDDVIFYDSQSAMHARVTLKLGEQCALKAPESAGPLFTFPSPPSLLNESQSKRLAWTLLKSIKKALA